MGSARKAGPAAKALPLDPSNIVLANYGRANSAAVDTCSSLLSTPETSQLRLFQTLLVPVMQNVAPHGDRSVDVWLYGFERDINKLIDAFALQVKVVEFSLSPLKLGIVFRAMFLHRLPRTAVHPFRHSSDFFSWRVAPICIRYEAASGVDFTVMRIRRQLRHNHSVHAFSCVQTAVSTHVQTVRLLSWQPAAVAVFVCRPIQAVSTVLSTSSCCTLQH